MPMFSKSFLSRYPLQHTEDWDATKYVKPQNDTQLNIKSGVVISSNTYMLWKFYIA